ncbi:Calcineurin-like phosphoesterase [Eubacterium coprostanoligenes]|uniref:Calcineurin-like phosphoesterase n=1 Tax=Eubacterium coprostanoligenes TaxID=290054 RepID=A0A1T4N7H6_9FIRM|nr:Calcineurin-like phosphoesterase [Eubacterium coprostanoligenes]
MTYTYVCSDLHGMFEKYIALVNTLKNSDQLYIIGDVIDRVMTV